MIRSVEELWQAYLDAYDAYNEHWLSYDQLFDKRTGGWKRGVDRTTLVAADNKLDRLLGTMFATYDAWSRTVKHEQRLATDVTLSNVAEDDYAVLVADSFEAAAEGIQWTLNSGLVAYKLIFALRGFAVREDSQEVPLCPTCA